MSTPDSLDESVQEACVRGDHKGAISLVLQQLGADVVRVIHARFLDEEQTAEVFSRFAEDLCVGLPNFQFRCTLRAWVFMIARNAGSRFLKRDIKRQRAQVPLSQLPELAHQLTRIRTQTLATTDAREKRLAELRAELSEEEQLLLMLRVDRNLDFREIALVMLESVDADHADVTREAARLRKRFQLLKERLRNRWNEQ